MQEAVSDGLEDDLSRLLRVRFHVCRSSIFSSTIPLSWSSTPFVLGPSSRICSFCPSSGFSLDFMVISVPRSSARPLPCAELAYICVFESGCDDRQSRLPSPPLALFSWRCWRMMVFIWSPVDCRKRTSKTRCVFFAAIFLCSNGHALTVCFDPCHNETSKALQPLLASSYCWWPFAVPFYFDRVFQDPRPCCLLCPLFFLWNSQHNSVFYVRGRPLRKG